MNIGNNIVGHIKIVEKSMNILKKKNRGNIKILRKYDFKEAWGYKQGFGHRTTEHDHIPNYLSGVLYLTNGNQKLLFKEINQEITPSVGKFVIFSSFLRHRAERNLSKEYKYGIAFNFSFNNSYATD